MPQVTLPVVRKNHKNQPTQQFDIINYVASLYAHRVNSVELRTGDPKTLSATLRSMYTLCLELGLTGIETR